MADEQQTTAQPQVEDQQSEGQQAPQPDLITRASEVKAPEPKPTDGFDRKKHDEVVSSLPPEVQEQVRAYENEIMSGASKKFREAAEIRKELERPWTPDRVQQLLNDQTFVSSAQAIAQQQALQQNPQGSNMNDQEWSALTEGEKKQFYAVQQNQAQLQGQMNQILSRQEDTLLSQRYKNYNPQAVDEIRHGLLSGSMQATREHLWKVHDYDAAVRRAYELGKQDRQTDIQGKMQASSPQVGVNASAAHEVGEKPKGMAASEWFKRLARDRIKQMEQTGKKVEF